MNIGIPREIKTREQRVSCTPAGVSELVKDGHRVFVERGAGTGSAFTDDMYRQRGATLLDTAAEVWDSSDMIMKVKEPLEKEFDYMKEGQILFTYLHLAADRELTSKLLEKKVIGVAYETIQKSDRSLPLLAPMSEVAGRLSIQTGSAALEAKNEGRGLLLSGVPGVEPAKVTILGGGISGINAAHLAVGLGAQVTILDISVERMRYLEDIFHSKAVTLMSNSDNIERCLSESDLVIGAVLIPGATAPKLIKREHLSMMKKGAAIVDIAIDQGGCAETSTPTTHDNPMYIVDNVVHYCVANMPGAVPLTSTLALTNVTLPYARALAGKGVELAMKEDRSLALGLNVYEGEITCRGVAVSFGMECSTPPFEDFPQSA